MTALEALRCPYCQATDFAVEVEWRGHGYASQPEPSHLVCNNCDGEWSTTGTAREPWPGWTPTA